MNRRLNLKVLTVLALIPAIGLVYLSQQYMHQLAPLLGTINLLGTLIHEGGHSLVALATGGTLVEMVIHPGGGGYAAISGGNFYLSLPAGYLSTTLLTALMFLVNNRTRWGEIIPLGLAIAFAYLTFQYGSKLEGGATTVIVGYFSAVLLIFISIHPNIRIPGTSRSIPFPDVVWMFIVNVICLYYAVGGLHSLSYLSRHAAHGNPDDVSVFTDMFFPSTDPTVTANNWFWLSIAVWVIVFGIVLHGFLKKKPE